MGKRVAEVAPLSPATDRGSSPEVADEKKNKRKLSNRESARRSRQRKQQRLEELIAEVTKFQDENAAMEKQIAGITQQFSVLDGKNEVLRTQHAMLSDRLNWLNAFIFQGYAGSGGGVEPNASALLMPMRY